MAWNGGEKCQECHKELLALKIPPIQIMQRMESLPCSKHGDPRQMTPRLSAWVEFFNVIAPYSTSQTALDHSLISKICEAYGIDFLEAFEMLSTINTEVVKRDGKNKGTRQSPETHEGSGA